MMIEKQSFGYMPGGAPVMRYTLTNKNGTALSVSTLGATITGLLARDRSGQLEDIVLGYDDAAAYLAGEDYLGATVGRVANRIGGARFTLEGKTYTLAANNGDNALHGGPGGFSTRLFTVLLAEGNQLKLGYLSPDGEEGYPGGVSVCVSYSLQEDDCISVEYEARSTRPTPISLTNHSYFNLNGAASGSVLDHLLTIHARSATEPGPGLVPTGRIVEVEGTPLNFTTPHPLGDAIHADHPLMRYTGGYDHNFVLDKGDAPAAVLHSPRSGRTLTLYTTLPGLQLYTGNFLHALPAGKGGSAYGSHCGVALEPQLFPDGVNQPGFDSGILYPGRVYRQSILYRLSAE